jgi:hypothetical protein
MSDSDDILFPERELDIQGETVVVREFSYLEAMKRAAGAKNLIAAIGKIISEADTIRLEELDAVIADHIDEWVGLLAASISKDASFVESLNDQDGSNLAMAFWEINGPFLLRRVMLNRVFQKSLAPV